MLLRFSPLFTVDGASLAVNPTLSTVAFTAPGSGAPQRLDLTYSYPNDPAPDTLRVILATRNGGAALTAAQLLAGTGTFLERVVVSPFSGTEVALSALTATSEAATAVDVILAEVNNGGVSAVVTETVSGLDFTPESRVSVATNTAGDEVIVTWSGTLFDPAAAPDIAAGDFAMTGHTLTSPVLSGATVTLSVSPSVANGDSDTLGYSGTALKDVNGNTIATFSGVAVTNNVPGATWLVDEDFTGLSEFTALTTLSDWESAEVINGGEIRGTGPASNGGALGIQSTIPSSNPRQHARNTTALPANMAAEIDVIVPAEINTGVFTAVGVGARWSAADDTGYMFRYQSTGTKDLYKRVSGSSTLLASGVTGVVTLPITFRIECEDEGSDCRIRVYEVGNPTPIISYLDNSSPLTGTRAAIRMNHSIGDAWVTLHSFMIAAFRAGAL